MDVVDLGQGLGKSGWLGVLLRRAVDEHRPQEVLTLAPQAKSGRARARTYLARVIRKSGLLYGTPATRNPAELASRPPEERLFLAVMGTFARIALDVAALVGAPPGPRREQLLVLFAALTGLVDDALEIHQLVRDGKAVPRRCWVKVEGALEQRALSIAGDPAYGLLLHNGAAYADANVFGRIAADYFARRTLSEEPTLRRLAVAARQKAVLVEVLTALACVERRPSFTARRAILRQLEDLMLPEALADEVEDNVRRAFERKRRDLPAVVKRVQSRQMKQFILEQTVLGSLVDGRRSDSEMQFIHRLADQLKVSRAALSGIELQVAEFYRQHRDVVDVFTVAANAGVMGDEMLDVVTVAVEKNYRRLMKEIRETGELSVLLAKAARGGTLTADERERMREQLIDVAKAIPALAIFAAPGGLFLLIALSKMLPFSLLPSSFQDEEQSKP